MTETPTDLPPNVTAFRPKDPTATERKRRSRAKAKLRRNGVTQSVTLKAQANGTTGGFSGPSTAIRDAAKAAGEVSQVIEFPVTRQVTDVTSESVTTPDISRPEIASAAAAEVPARFRRRTSGPSSITSCRSHRAILTLAALGLASVSAWYAITGLTSIFIGAFYSVIALGVAFEIGKLSAVSALPALRWGPLKVAMAALVAVLMGLNAVGCYGYLSKAQLEHTITGDASMEARQAQVRAKLDVQAALVADLDRQIAQIDHAVDIAATRGRTRGAMNLAQDQRANRAELLRQRQHEADTLAGMRAEEAGLAAQRRIAAVDLGPVRYLAELLGAPVDNVLRWFVLLVACLLDPAAVLLLYVAAHGRNHENGGKWIKRTRLANCRMVSGGSPSRLSMF